MAAGDRPINEDLLRWVWIVDEAATKELEVAYKIGRLDEQPVVGQFHELMRAIESDPTVKWAYLDAWARHVTSEDPNSERHYRALVSVLDGLLAKHPDAQIAVLIPACLETLLRAAFQGDAE